jgi:hypothetical protein
LESDFLRQWLAWIKRGPSSARARGSKVVKIVGTTKRTIKKKKEARQDFERSIGFETGAKPTAGTDKMIPERSMTTSRGKGQWRESRRSDPWCRSRTGEQSASSLNGQIPSTIPTSTSDGVSKCSSTLASGASGLRTGAAAPRLRPNIGCSRITSKSSAMAAPPSTQPMANAFAEPITPARPFKPGRADKVLDEGGRGFISLEGSRPVTAHGLMRRFFLAPELLNFFLGFKKSNADGQPFSLSKQSSRAIQAPLSGYLFSQVVAPLAEVTLSKNVAKFGGGGYGGFF